MLQENIPIVVVINRKQLATFFFLPKVRWYFITSSHVRSFIRWSVHSIFFYLLFSWNRIAILWTLFAATTYQYTTHISQCSIETKFISYINFHSLHLYTKSTKDIAVIAVVKLMDHQFEFVHLQSKCKRCDLDL